MSGKCKPNALLFPPVSYPWDEQINLPKHLLEFYSGWGTRKVCWGKGEGKDLQKWPYSPSCPALGYSRFLLPPSQNLQRQGEGRAGQVVKAVGCGHHLRTQRCPWPFASEKKLQWGGGKHTTSPARPPPPNRRHWHRREWRRVTEWGKRSQTFNSREWAEKANAHGRDTRLALYGKTIQQLYKMLILRSSSFSPPSLPTVIIMGPCEKRTRLFFAFFFFFLKLKHTEKEHLKSTKAYIALFPGYTCKWLNEQQKCDADLVIYPLLLILQLPGIKCLLFFPLSATKISILHRHQCKFIQILN